ncbi:GM11179 [Drosophila sechellia]|uniref:GM11179 n=1 Tax=Drosophila sechellia TaxID=7238 RepID=B4HX05_DROSE|nr:GM11179 [Drosophila sechellia]
MHSKRQRPLGSILIIIIIVIIITDGFSRGFGTGSCATSEATAAGAGQGRWSLSWPVGHNGLSNLPPLRSSPSLSIAPSRSHLSGLLTQLLQQPQRIELLLLRLRSRNCLHLSASLLFPTFLLPLPMALPPRLLFFLVFFAVFVLFFFSRLDVQLSICNIKHLHRGPHEWASDCERGAGRIGCGLGAGSAPRAYPFCRSSGHREIQQSDNPAIQQSGIDVSIWRGYQVGAGELELKLELELELKLQLETAAVVAVVLFA